MKAKITITEALAELKTIDKRIENARDFIMKYAVRQGSTIDPLQDEGGSDVAVPKKMQSLRDLLQRKVAVRSAINAKNATTPLTVSGVTRTVSEWIIWRREVLQIELTAYRNLQHKVLDARKQCVAAGIALNEDGKQPERVQEAGCFISESAIQRHIEQLTETESALDGQLSLINATTLVEV